MKKILKWSVIAFVAIIVIAALASGGGSGDSQETAAKQETTSQTTEAEPSEEPTEKAEPDLTAGQENALRSAEMYLDTMPFSQKGLAKQLKFEDYSAKDAAFAVKHVEADWSEQAVKAAEQYLETMPFSRDALVRQLKFDGFTQAQAEHGAGQALGG